MDAFVTSIDVRFRDIDAMGHVNNAVYATYLEQARTDYFRRVLEEDIAKTSTVIATLSIDYRDPILLEDESATVEVTVPDVGTSSIPMEYTVRTDRGVAAEAESVQVLYDTEAETSVPIPDDWRSTIREYHDE
ncbi:acyl-CoA thioesterase [Halopenitus salinus]|jgi:acyl-CoA thioester hydrolase|uniref:Acyl-CoA thioesterase n=1 Tax=Halopenitus salinus TaxID=1198295 RepID=A0ABD5UTQ2_9EURY